MASIVNASRPGPSDHRPNKSVSTPAGYAGNAARDGTPLRQWASRSYGASDGRAASSLSPNQYGTGSVSTTHVEGLSNQLPNARGEGGAPSFHERTRRYVQDRTPVRDRKIG